MNYDSGFKAIDNHKEELFKVAKQIAANPELAWNEKKAHDWLVELLKKLGFQVTPHFHNIDTAFEARFGSGEPTVVLCSEYDALPGIGHACGHNLIAISAIAAGIGLKKQLEESKKSGTILIYGTPAEESEGAKINLVQCGAFDKVDFSMMIHPTKDDQIYMSSLAMVELKVKYFGKASHAAAAPFAGINALDATVLAYNNVSAARQQFRPDQRVHGVITNGGDKPNIIPAESESHYYIRAKNAKELEELKEKILNCFEAAAIATGCSKTITYCGPPLLNVISNDNMAELFTKHYTQLSGRQLPSKSVQMQMPTGSTDMGNVSYKVPSLHPCYSIGGEADNHTIEFTEKVVTDEALNATLIASKAMFSTVYDILIDKELLEKVKSTFKKQMKEHK